MIEEKLNNGRENETLLSTLGILKITRRCVGSDLSAHLVRNTTVFHEGLPEHVPVVAQHS